MRLSRKSIWQNFLNNTRFPHYATSLLLLLGIALGIGSFFVMPIPAMGALTLEGSKILFSVLAGTGIPSVFGRFLFNSFYAARKLNNSRLWWGCNITFAFVTAVLAVFSCLSFMPAESITVSMLYSASSVLGIQVLVGVPLVMTVTLVANFAFYQLKKWWQDTSKGKCCHATKLRTLLVVLLLAGCAVTTVGFGSIFVMPVAPAIAGLGMFAVVMHQVILTLVLGTAVPMGIYKAFHSMFGPEKDAAAIHQEGNEETGTASLKKPSFHLGIDPLLDPKRSLLYNDDKTAMDIPEVAV